LLKCPLYREKVRKRQFLPISLYRHTVTMNILPLHTFFSRLWWTAAPALVTVGTKDINAKELTVTRSRTEKGNLLATCKFSDILSFPFNSLPLLTTNRERHVNETSGVTVTLHHRYIRSTSVQQTFKPRKTKPVTSRFRFLSDIRCEIRCERIPKAMRITSNFISDIR
jgi:hypothetical protein